jgi:ectoine hydroxylase-related dioxygenase (phytanoyl-CoA dioxygenase family)
MNDRQLTRDEIERFERDGFLLVEDILSPADLEDFGAAVDSSVADRVGDDKRSLEEKTLYEQSFIQCMNLWEDSLEVRRLAFHPSLGEMAASLLGADAVRIWHDQALYKEVGSRKTDAHQDRPFWPITPADQVTAWIPFNGSARNQGAMAYVPGSHRLGLEKFVDISHTFQEPYDVVNDPAIAGIEPVWVTAPPGSVVFHHSLTVHLAEGNEGPDTRRVYCIIYFADGCVRRNSIPHPTVDRQGVEVDKKICGDVSPIVWPRPSPDLPPTPTTRPPRVGFA